MQSYQKMARGRDQRSYRQLEQQSAAAALALKAISSTTLQDRVTYTCKPVQHVADAPQGIIHCLQSLSQSVTQRVIESASESVSRSTCLLSIVAIQTDRHI